MPSATTSELPSRIGSCRITGVLGRGGGGVVYRAVREPQGEPVAIKCVARSRPEEMAALRREILALRRTQHPNVVRVLEDGLEDGVPWYAMELVEGATLDRHAREQWDPMGPRPRIPEAALHSL